MHAARRVADHKKEQVLRPRFRLIRQPFSETVVASIFLFAWTCAPEKYLSNEESLALLDLMDAELRCSKTDLQRLVSFIGTSVTFIEINGSSNTLERSLGQIRIRVVLLSSGLEDECFTVDGETNISLALDSVQLWPGILARRVVVDGEK